MKPSASIRNSSFYSLTGLATIAWGDLVVLSRLERDATGVHGKHVAKLKRVVLVLGDDMHVQVMHGVAVGTKVNLVGN